MSAIALLTVGCAGPGFRVPSDPLTLLGDNAAVYAFIPVASHRPLLTAAADTLETLEARDRSSIEDLLDRTEYARAAVYADRSVELILTGDFPRAAEPFVFPEAKGWKRVKGHDGRKWYEAGSVSAAIPSSGLVCVTLKTAMSDMLAREAGSVMPPVSEAFAALSASPGSTDMAFSLVQPETILPGVLGADVSLPVTRMDGIAVPSKAGATYALGLGFSAPDANRARALATLLRLLSGVTPEVEGTTVWIKTDATSVETLAGFASFLLF